MQEAVLSSLFSSFMYDYDKRHGVFVRWVVGKRAKIFRLVWLEGSDLFSKQKMILHFNAVEWVFCFDVDRFASVVSYVTRLSLWLAYVEFLYIFCCNQTQKLMISSRFCEPNNWRVCYTFAVRITCVTYRTKCYGTFARIKFCRNILGTVCSTSEQFW